MDVKFVGLWPATTVAELKSSEAWAEELGAEVMDPDGWDRSNFQFSWYEEKISHEEFDRRFSGSTVMGGSYTPARWRQ